MAWSESLWTRQDGVSARKELTAGAVFTCPKAGAADAKHALDEQGGVLYSEHPVIIVHEDGADQSTSEVGPRLKALRQQQGLSMRQLAGQAGVAASYVSSVEAGRVSPTLATLRKLLVALGQDLASFFSSEVTSPREYVFRHANMRQVADATRRYTLVLPRRPDVCCEILDELFVPSRQAPPYESIASELAGYVLEGEVLLEIEGEAPQTLQAGDAFYVPANKPVRGRCQGGQPARLITIATPPRY